MPLLYPVKLIELQSLEVYYSNVFILYEQCVKTKKRIKSLSLQKESLNNMDIRATKLELMQLMLNTQKEQVLQRIKDVFEQEGETDYWDELSLEDQSAIDEGLEQLDKGQYVAHESVSEEIKNRFNF